MYARLQIINISRPLEIVVLQPLRFLFHRKKITLCSEEVPERVVLARGAGVFEYFETYEKSWNEPIATYTRAKVFTEVGKRIP